MNNIRIFSLYSGSGGNSFLISTEKTSFLIDAGKNCKHLCAGIRACGLEPEQISAVFLTHEHCDHIQALPVFLKKYPVPVHLPEGCVYRLEREPSVQPLLCPHPPIHTEMLGDIRITSFPTPHDSHASVGYRMEIPTEDGVLRIGYATDIGYVSPAVEENLTGCHAVILESNHDPEMLQTGSYPNDLKRRIASRYGHLSNSDSACFAAHLMQSGTRSIMLAHLSQENNTPDTAYAEYMSTLACEQISLCIAAPDEMTELKLNEVPIC